MSARVFDDEYYRRFYEDPKTRVYSKGELAHLAQYVFSFAAWNQIEIRRVLDIGAGIGLWRDWITEHRPKVKYTGTEISEAMCKKNGYLHQDIARWRDRNKYDLIICQGVLQYLPDPDIAPAIANIASMARGLVFFEAITRTDMRERADLDRTDVDVFVRNGSYYRRQFGRHFTTVGCGLYWPISEPSPFWELDVGGAR